MDALRRDAAILRGLLLAGPGITIALLLFALLAVTLGITSDEKRVGAFLLSIGFSVVGLVGRAASRLPMYCAHAAMLGIPRHAMAMRRAQCILIALMTLPPIAFALWIGGDFHSVAVIVGCAAFGIYVLQIAFLAVIFSFVAKGLAASGVDIWGFLFGTTGSAMILAGSAWAFIRWLREPQRIETESAGSPHYLADIAHEDLDQSELDSANDVFERQLEDVLSPRDPHRLTPRRLWIGLGHDPDAEWRVIAIGLLLALAALVVFHFWKHSRMDYGIYMAVSAMFAAAVFARLNGLSVAWLRTSAEQSLLVLAARWPAHGAFKIAFLRLIWTGIPELLVAWAIFSGITLALGWIDWRSIEITAFGQLAALASSLGIMLSYVSLAQVRLTKPIPMIYALTTIAAIVTLMISMEHDSTTGVRVGTGMVLVPAALAALAFAMRRRLMPVQVVHRD